MDKKTACFTFAVSPASDPSGSGPMRFRGVAYSGGLIPQYGYYGDTCIDLSSITLPDRKLFALVDHDPGKRAGQFEARLENNAIIVEGSLFASTEAGREVAALMAEGAPWQMSVGIQADAENTDKRCTVTCNGQAVAVHTLFKNAVLREVSFVPVGADPNTTVAAFSRNLAGMVDSPVPRPVGETDMTEALQQQIADLSAKLEAETAARQEAEQALDAIKLAARQDAIKQLEADLERDLSDDESKAMAELPDFAFTILSAALISMKPSKPNAPVCLFVEQATDGRGEDTEAQKLILAQATLRNQVGGKAA